jgi:hypothetical protein
VSERYPNCSLCKIIAGEPTGQIVDEDEDLAATAGPLR